MKDYAMVTGASSGIGLEFAKQLADKGFNLVLVARRKDRLEKIASKLKKKGVECIIVLADLSDIEECRRLIKETEKLPIKIFINNAGFGACGPFKETNVD